MAGGIGKLRQSHIDFQSRCGSKLGHGARSARPRTIGRETMFTASRRPGRWLIPTVSFCIGLTATTALAQSVEPVLAAPGEAPPPGFAVKGRAYGDDVPHPAGEKRRE